MKWIYGVICALAWGSVLLAQSARVDRITIESQWVGLSPKLPPRLEETIVRRGEEFYWGEKKLDRASVEALERALTEPALPRATAENLGITQEWLEANAGEAVRNIKSMYGRVQASRLAALKRDFTDRRTVERAIQALFHQGVHTDDYPRVKITAVLAGRVITAETESQHYSLLPWTVKNAQGEAVTYDAHLSRAVARVMPEGTVNRERLAANDLASILAGALWQLSEKR